MEKGNITGITHFFYKQHFHKQRQAEIGKKNKLNLRNNLRLNFCYLKSDHFFHQRFCFIFCD